MAKLTVVLLVSVLFGNLCGQSSSVSNRELAPRENTHDFVDFVLFRNFHEKSAASPTENEIESNDIPLDFRTDYVKEKYFGENIPADIRIKNNVILELLNEEQPGEIEIWKYNVISKKHSKTSKKKQGRKYNRHSGIFHKQISVDSNTLNNRNHMLNKLVDFLLKVVCDEIHKTGKDQVAIPDVDEQFSTKILLIPVNGRFRAEDGWFRNLSTVYRTGDVDITSSAINKISVEFDLGLKTTQFGYNKYEAELGGIDVSGSLSGSIASDSIATKITLVYVNGTCKAHLDSLKVTVLNGIHLTLTGASGFGWLLTFIANCVSGSYRDQIINTVEQVLAHTLQEKLEIISCGHLFS